MKTKNTIRIYCPCGYSSNFVLGDERFHTISDQEVKSAFNQRGWSFVRKNSDGTFAGVCEECRDLMTEDEE